jgi:hypothetical protein
MARFTVENWAPEYGSPIEESGGEDLRNVEVDVGVELPLERWEPQSPVGRTMPDSIGFVDGVRRIDARVWFANGDGSSMGICASFAAGVVRCAARAEVAAIVVGRGVFARLPAEPIETAQGTYQLFGTATDEFDALNNEVQQQMGRLEREVAATAGGLDLLVLDGPLTGRESIPGAVGYIKSHRAAYLPEQGRNVVAALGAGQRTPLFLTQTTWSRYSWYLRLPGGQGHPWAGVVRCEVTTGRTIAEVRAVADVTAAVLPRYASQEQRDTRAPQNLLPIGGLEQQLRHRLGDRDLMVRALRRAAG